MLKVTWKNPERRDEWLMKRFLDSGDLEILGELYNRYMHLVYGVCLKYLKDRNDAQDAVMQIFEKLITELPNHEVIRFRGWLYVLTKNHCLMYLRSKQITSRRMNTYKIEQEFMESEEELHPIDRDDESLGNDLRACINQLREEQKACIELFYFKKLCYQEIAEKLSIDEKKVKSHLQNGKRNLKICLENKNVRKENI